MYPQELVRNSGELGSGASGQSMGASGLCAPARQAAAECISLHFVPQGQGLGAWTGSDGCRACGFAQFQPQRWAAGAASSRRARTISAEGAKKESEEDLSMARQGA
jgi:hypothetical protein